MQFGNNQPAVIRWDKLLLKQKMRFLNCLQRGCTALKDRKLLHFLIERRGLFNEVVSLEKHKLIVNKMIEADSKAWLDYMALQMQENVYGRDVIALLPDKSFAVEAGPAFVPKGIGAASYTLEQAQLLSIGNR